MQGWEQSAQAPEDVIVILSLLPETLDLGNDFTLELSSSPAKYGAYIGSGL